MLTEAVLAQLRHLLRPLATRVANTAARALIRRVDDSTMMQLLQIEVLKGEVIDKAEHFQPYGISGVPPAGADGIVVFPNGDRSHPLVFAVGHRASRPTDGEDGELTVYNGLTGAKIVMTKDGDIVATPAPGRHVLVSDGGSTDRLVKRSEFLAHGHPTAATGPVSPPSSVLAGPDVGQFPGTTLLESQ